MITIKFCVNLSVRLSDEFNKGFTRISINRLPHGHPSAIFLWHADGTGLMIRSEMHDIAERFEVGALIFSHAVATDSNAPLIDLPEEFSFDLKASKLVLSDQSVSAESGILLKGDHGGEIVILAGALPYALTVKAPFIIEAFEPEYDLSSYLREPMEP